VHGAHRIQAGQPVERQPVVPRPLVRASQPQTELLATDQGGFTEMPTTSACLASRIAVRTPLSPSPAMTTRGRVTGTTQPRAAFFRSMSANAAASSARSAAVVSQASLRFLTTLAGAPTAIE